MPDSEHAIVIAATAEDWPDGRTLTPRRTTREPNGTLWFGADLDREGDQIWFRIDENGIRRIPHATPEGRGRRVLDALHVRLAAPQPVRCGINRFDVRVDENVARLLTLDTDRSLEYILQKIYRQCLDT